jgi:hypothetical protein
MSHSTLSALSILNKKKKTNDDMEPRARPRGRPDDRKRLDVVTPDVLSSDESDDSDLPGERSNPDGEAVDDAAGTAVVSRVHAGIASFTELVSVEISEMDASIDTQVS